jgi:hypothetical protein
LTNFVRSTSLHPLARSVERGHYPLHADPAYGCTAIRLQQQFLSMTVSVFGVAERSATTTSAKGGIDFHARHIISDLESKQVADPDLSLECVHGKFFNNWDAEFRRYYHMLSGFPADHEVERQEEPAGLAMYRGSIIPTNIRTRIERQK